MNVLPTFHLLPKWPKVLLRLSIFDDHSGLWNSSPENCMYNKVDRYTAYVAGRGSAGRSIKAKSM